MTQGKQHLRGCQFLAPALCALRAVRLSASNWKPISPDRPSCFLSCFRSVLLSLESSPSPPCQNTTPPTTLKNLILHPSQTARTSEARGPKASPHTLQASITAHGGYNEQLKLAPIIGPIVKCGMPTPYLWLQGFGFHQRIDARLDPSCQQALSPAIRGNQSIVCAETDLYASTQYEVATASGQP